METTTAILNPSPIVEARKQRNLTQTQLGRQVGVTQSTIADIERGAKLPSLKLALRLCSYLDISYNSLFFSENNR